MASSTEGVNGFGVNLYNELVSCKDDRDNVFFSAASVYTALSMVHLAADGNTKQEMEQVLKNNDPSSVQKAWTKLLSTLSQEAVLEIANKIWVELSSTLKASFAENVKSVFGAEESSVDFKNNPAQAVQLINAWTREKTHGKIDNVLSNDDVNSSTRVVLTNAIYFKGAWVNPFKKYSTQKRDFFFNENDKTSIDMMHQEGTFVSCEEATYKVLFMPYKGTRINMVILLPNKIDGLGELEKSVENNTPELLKKWSTGTRQKVEIFIPKFKFEMKVSLKEVLQNLGLRDLFSPSACNLKGMSEGEDVCVSDVIHKSFVEVDEEGTEAAAVTAIMCCLTSMPMPQAPPTVFRADRPFMFYIYDTEHDLVVFSGRLANPNA